MDTSQMSSLLLALDVVFGLCSVYLLQKLFASRPGPPQLPLPPGPKPLPLIGNLLDMPKGPEGPFWAKHKELYGPISSVSAFGSTIIILNDMDTAYELLEKRSAIYSSRPSAVFGAEMVGFGPVTTLLPYGEALKSHRKRIHNCIGTHAAMKRFESLQEIETHRLLLRLLNDPDDYVQHIRTNAGAIILKIAYGYTIEPNGPDPFVELATRAVDIFSAAFVPGKWIVDIVPIFRYLPEWIPGMRFNRIAREWNAVVLDFVNRPYAFVKHQMATGKALSSFTSDNIEKGVLDKEDEELLKWTAAALYGGGTDTTVSAMLTFFLAMILNPPFFKTAQEEIDRVIGPDRLPTLADRPSLPYIDAILKETLRWQNVVPAGIAHVTTEEDSYMGYHIPKGAVIVPNIWQMAHDPMNYCDPFVFKPERFLEDNGQIPESDPRLIAFGFGRRICPGKEVADTSLFLSIAMSLAVFNISRSKDKDGHEIELDVQYLPGVVSHPTPFQCNIVPRSERAVSLIKSVLDEHPFEKSDAETLKAL